MRDDIRVVLASNRGPVSFVERGGELEIKRGAGGLAGAVDPVVRRLGPRATWISAAVSDADRRALASGAVDRLPSHVGYSCEFLDIDPVLYSGYYDVVSNRMLWFANHGLLDELSIESLGELELGAWDESYELVNGLFAEAALRAADRDALILFQDYHLTRAPALVRAARPQQPVLHFTHSSFFGPGDAAKLPERIVRAVVEGMLGADLVGFHTRAWAGNFMDCCDGLGLDVDRSNGFVDLGERRAWVRTYPIQIDVPALRERASHGPARSWAAKLRGLASGRLIVRADRTEPSKNIVRGFEAFGLMLDRRPDLRGSVHFAASIYESRQTMDEYRSYASQIRHAVSAVNDRHPGAITLFLEDDYDRSVGALSAYDVLLVNPLRDGMNLVSKEGAALNEMFGVLILSKNAGSFEELGRHAIPIGDPADVDETARALEAALEMSPPERERRARGLRARVESSSPEQWAISQIEDLRAINGRGEPLGDL